MNGIPLIKFQFLYGAIKRKTGLIMKINNTYFNSFMVRLKVYTTETRINLTVFQFLYGAIKSCYHPQLKYALTYFNSFMVRLKVR